VTNLNAKCFYFEKLKQVTSYRTDIKDIYSGFSGCHTGAIQVEADYGQLGLFHEGRWQHNTKIRVYNKFIWGWQSNDIFVGRIMNNHLVCLAVFPAVNQSSLAHTCREDKYTAVIQIKAPHMLSCIWQIHGPKKTDSYID
jgi:hypothetical protein